MTASGYIYITLVALTSYRYIIEKYIIILVDRPTCRTCVLMGYRVCREYSTAVDLSLLVVECAMELALDIIGEHFTTLYQMSRPTYLSREVFPLRR